jgi:hypothetical protein
MTYPVPGQQPPQQVTPEQAQQAAAAQVGQVAADLGPGPQASAADLGVAAMQAGAQPGEVDAVALLNQIRAMQARLDSLEAEKRTQQAPAVVVYGQALADHVQAKVSAHPFLVGHPDNSISVGADLAQKVLDAAQDAEQNPDAVKSRVTELEQWVTAHARQFPHIDWGYVVELAGETAAAAAKLAA